MGIWDSKKPHYAYEAKKLWNSLMDYIGALEKHLGMKAKKDFLPIQPGDVTQTSSDTNELNNWIDFKPNTSIDFGISKFVDWYLSKYKKL